MQIRLKEGRSPQVLELQGVAVERNPDDVKGHVRFHQLLYGRNDRDRCLRHLDLAGAA